MDGFRAQRRPTDLNARPLRRLPALYEIPDRRPPSILPRVLSAILLAGVSVTAAAHLYLAAVIDLDAGACHRNMRAIALAAEAYRSASPSHQWPGSVADMVGARRDIKVEPLCPASHRHYWLRTDSMGGLIVVCPATSSGCHGTFASGGR